MSRGYRISVVANVVLLAMLAVTAWAFLVRGNVVPGDDGRTAVLVTPAERARVMADMRAFLEAVQAITAAAAARDVPGIVRAARAVGSAATGGESLAFMGKLPLEMKTIGFSTHAAFDALAANAEKSGDTAAALAELGGLMLNCTGCHAGYSFVTEPARK